MAGPLGERLERIMARVGTSDDDADVVARLTAEANERAWAEVQAGVHLPSVAGEQPRRSAAPVDVADRTVPVPEAVMALGWSHVWAWVCFAALTHRRGATVSAAEVAAVAGWSVGHTRRLLAALLGLGGDLVRREGRRWAPACLWRDITGYRDRDGRWHAPAHGRFQHHSVRELAAVDRAGRRRAILLAGVRLWCRQRRGDQARPVYRRTLARWFGCSRRTVDRVLRQLVEARRLSFDGGQGGLTLVVLDTT